MTAEDALPGAGLDVEGLAPAAGAFAEQRQPGPTGGASWFDWLLARIRAAPGPSWAFYLSTFVAFAVVGHAAAWLGGAVRPWTLDSLFVVQATFPLLVLVGVEWVNAVALRSLRTLRPALAVDDAGMRGIAADLVRTPRGLAAAAGLAGVVFGIASVLTNPEVYELRPGVGPILWLWVLIYSPVACALTAAFVAHVAHQVRVVMGVHRTEVRVDLFRLDPLYAFSNLTAFVGIQILGAAAYAVGALVLVGVRFTTLELAWFGAVIPIAILVFVAPLLGLHGRIEAEKARRLTEAGEALDAAVREVHRRLRDGELEGMGELNSGIGAATSAYSTISKVSTWPWRPETLRGFISAVALPILLWLVTAFLGRVI